MLQNSSIILQPSLWYVAPTNLIDALLLIFVAKANFCCKSINLCGKPTKTKTPDLGKT
jgi:hypothetical protein